MELLDHQRNAILQEMGIQTYVPRQAIPGAKASPRYAERADVQATRATASAPSLERTVPASILPVATEHAQRLEPVAVSAVPAPISLAAPAQPAPTGQVDAARFVFAYIPVNEHLAVINELPWARSASLTPSCRQLLADMLKAIGAPCEANDLSPMIFTWPLADAGDMPVDPESARHMLEGFLSRRLKLRPVSYLMVLAEQSARFLFPTDATFQGTGEALIEHPRFPVQMVLTHSLNAMEAVRELKRPAWQALQPLKYALAQHGASSNKESQS